MRKLNRIEKPNHNEKTESKLCKKWLVIESCSGCLFETLCRLEQQNKRRQQQED